jgi:type II secretory pathway pseudopilin PulG
MGMDFSLASAGLTRLRLGRSSAAFTLIEVAICLAIISFALVAIIGVLPIGMNTQRDIREETIINQDASVLLEAIRSGARHSDDLTKYVYAITNTGSPILWPKNGYDSSYLTSGERIVGLLSTPEYEISGGTVYSNHIVAYVRSMSGQAAEKPPQDDSVIREDTFTYRLFCVNAPTPVDNYGPLSGFSRQLAGNQRELRLTFLWPQQPNGKLGIGRQTFRTTIAGQLVSTNDNGQTLYFYQPQSFINAP